MDCALARLQLLDHRRGKLASDLHAEVDAHLATCPSCRKEDEADRELGVLLEQRLPRRSAPESLKRAVATAIEGAGGDRRIRAPAPRRMGALVAMASGAALSAALAASFGLAWRARSTDEHMVSEAVNDHLRVLYSQRQVEVESGGIHQVKPWFEGRLDFAPAIEFGGDDEFPLQGGAVGYFIDRKAATFVFKRRLHLITLFVFRADGLSFPLLGARPVGPSARGQLTTLRGFHVLRWQKGDLGYALVSDVNEDDLIALGEKIAGPSEH